MQPFFLCICPLFCCCMYCMFPPVIAFFMFVLRTCNVFLVSSCIAYQLSLLQFDYTTLKLTFYSAEYMKMMIYLQWQYFQCPLNAFIIFPFMVWFQFSCDNYFYIPPVTTIRNLPVKGRLWDIILYSTHDNYRKSPC